MTWEVLFVKRAMFRKSFVLVTRDRKRCNNSICRLGSLFMKLNFAIYLDFLFEKYILLMSRLELDIDKVATY